MRRPFRKYVKVDSNKIYGKQITVPVIKKFDYTKRTQDWNRLDRVLKHKDDVYYINEKIQSFAEYLKDLFCLDFEVQLDLRPYMSNQRGNCWNSFTKAHITLGCKDGLRATSLVHEFFHGAEYDHERDVNGYTDFVSNCAKDFYSPLIVYDIFGRKEVIL